MKERKEKRQRTETDGATGAWRCDNDAALGEIATERDTNAESQSCTASALLAAVQGGPHRAVRVSDSVNGTRRRGGRRRRRCSCSLCPATAKTCNQQTTI